ncbi:MAG: MFS transporter [Rhodospirillales bacterium]
MALAPTSTVNLPADPLESAYAVLSGEDATERACKAIPDEQCTSVPRNFVLNVLNGSCTKLAEQLASPTLVLPWLVSSLGAPVWVIGWFVPVKQAGSMIPQLAVAARIRSLAQRKWAWAGAGAFQGIALLVMAAAVLFTPPETAAWLMLVLFALFSVASGVGSVAFQDVTGKTVPKGVRGRMLANRASIGGALTLVAAVVLKYMIGEGGGAEVYAALVAAAAVLWLAGAFFFAVIDEVPGAQEGGRDMLGEVRASLRLFRDDPGFSKYLGMRIALLISVELALPYFALLAQQSQGGSLASLGILIFAVGFANMISSWIWGTLADRSARRVCVLSGVAGIAAVAAALISAYAVPGTYAIWAFGGVFVIAGIAEAGVRLGRKTYLVDAAPKDERPLYTALSNTLAGLVALAAGGLGVIAYFTGVTAIVVALAAVGVIGILFALAMPEAADD